MSSSEPVLLSPEAGYRLWAPSWDRDPSPIVALEERTIAPRLADLSDAKLRDTNLSGTLIGKGTRTTLSDPPVSEVVFARLIQTQLDEAKADLDNPPKIDPVVVDAETGKPLVWRVNRTGFP